LVAITDDADAVTVRAVQKWYLFVARGSRTFYARGRLGGRNVFMHLLIFGSPNDGLETHHKNGNGLDNQRANLERVSHARNIKAAHAHKPYDRPLKRNINRVRAKLKTTGETVLYYYHNPTRTRLPEYPGHPAFEKALAEAMRTKSAS
jgi:hypothetical protein